MRKATNHESDARTHAVTLLLLAGASRPDILQHCTAQWGVKVRQTDIYIEKARKRLQESSKFDRDEEIGRAIGRLHDLYGRCLKIQDYKAALAVTREMSVLLGLNAPHAVNLTADVTGDIKIINRSLYDPPEPPATPDNG